MMTDDKSKRPECPKCGGRLQLSEATYHTEIGEGGKTLCDDCGWSGFWAKKYPFNDGCPSCGNDELLIDGTQTVKPEPSAWCQNCGWSYNHD